MNIAVRLFACMQELPHFEAAKDTAARANLVQTVLDEYHTHGAAGTNSKYKMDRKMQNAISNVNTMVGNLVKWAQSLPENAPFGP